MDNLIVYATHRGTMSIYKPNIYLFSKKNFVKIIKLMQEDYLSWDYNRAQLIEHIKSEQISLKNMYDRNVRQLSGIKIEQILKRFDYYIFLLTTLD